MEVDGTMHKKSDKMKLYIKYMMSKRCIMVVKEELKKLGLHFIIVDLGEVEIMETLADNELQELKIALHLNGFELIDDKKTALIDTIKSSIIEMIHQSEELPKTNYCDDLSLKLNCEYSYLSHLFTEYQGSTIKQFIITHKIERVKELLMYEDYTLTEISQKMQYSSVAHLSNQFKKITGLSASEFQKLQGKRKNNYQ